MSANGILKLLIASQRLGGFQMGPQPTVKPQRGKTYKATDKFQPLTDAELMEFIDRNNKRCPFYQCVGQDNVIEQLLALLISAVKSDNHALPQPTALMFTGAASAGKTEFAKRTAGPKGLDLPFVETDAKNIKGTETIFELAAASCEEAGIQITQSPQQAKAFLN